MLPQLRDQQRPQQASRSGSEQALVEVDHHDASALQQIRQPEAGLGLAQHRPQTRAQHQLAQLVEHRGYLHRLGPHRLGLVPLPEDIRAQRIGWGQGQHPASEGRIGQQRHQPHQRRLRDARQRQ